MAERVGFLLGAVRFLSFHLFGVEPFEIPTLRVGNRTAIVQTEIILNGNIR